MVTFMATMVPPTEKSKLQEKRGWEALNQGTRRTSGYQHGPPSKYSFPSMFLLSKSRLLY